MERIIVNGVNREMTKAEYDKTLVNRVNPRINEIEERKRAIKQELSDLDYKNHKRQEGYYTDEEWQTHIEYRKSLRDEMNGLQ